MRILRLPFARPVLVATATAFALLLSSCGGASPAATVGGEPITDEELAHGADLFRFLSAVNQQPCGQAEPSTDETEESACNRFVLTNLIELELTDTYAEQEDIAIDDAELDQAIAGLDEQLGAEAIDEQLAANDLTRSDLRELARRFAVLREVARAVTAEALDDDELRARYERDITSFTTVEVAHILVASREEADEVYSSVTAPGSTRDDFLELAKEVSIDPGAQENSGAYPPQLASGYVPEFANAAVALEPGEISEPIQTEFGWHVLLLDDKQATPFEDARQSIIEQSSGEEFGQWLRDRLGPDDLEVNPRYGRFDLETLTVQRIGGTDPDASPTAPPEGPVNTPTQQP